MQMLGILEIERQIQAPFLHLIGLHSNVLLPLIAAASFIKLLLKQDIHFSSHFNLPLDKQLKEFRQGVTLGKGTATQN